MRAGRSVGGVQVYVYKEGSCGTRVELVSGIVESVSLAMCKPLGFVRRKLTEASQKACVLTCVFVRAVFEHILLGGMASHVRLVHWSAAQSGLHGMPMVQRIVHPLFHLLVRGIVRSVPQHTV